MTREESQESGIGPLVASEYLRLYPDESAKVLEGEDPSQAAMFLSSIQPNLAAVTLNRVIPPSRARLLDRLDPESAGKILEAMDPSKIVIAFVQLPHDTVDALLSKVSKRLASDLREMMTYPPTAAWHLMEGNVLSFRATTQAADALHQIQDSGIRNASRFHLVDDEGLLVGTVRLQDMALAPAGQPLNAISGPRPTAVQAIEPTMEVMRLFEEHKTSSIPVVDFEGKLLGVIRYEGLVNAAQQEALEGIQSMVGASPDEGALSSPLISVRKRLPWLQINLITAFMAAAVVGLFENLIAQFTALAVLLPVVAGQSGNTGAQALAVSVRGLTLKEIRVTQWFLLIRKELLAGFLNGCAVAVVTGAGVWIWSRSTGLVAVIVISMVVAMMIASCSGAAIPLILKALKQDPAQSSSIILTTVTDVFGFLSFLGLAFLLSGFLPQG